MLAVTVSQEHRSSENTGLDNDRGINVAKQCRTRQCRTSFAGYKLSNIHRPWPIKTATWEKFCTSTIVLQYLTKLVVFTEEDQVMYATNFVTVLVSFQKLQKIQLKSAFLSEKYCGDQ